MTTVHIYSFSYRTRGYPRDEWGHGGGFVFDCRCLPNPGRLAEYAPLTGLDPAVADWLEASEPVVIFTEHVRGLVELALWRYEATEFSDLSVAFGCTGGRHRSVYCAERLRESLAARENRVTIQHLELEAEP